MHLAILEKERFTENRQDLVGVVGDKDEGDVALAAR